MEKEWININDRLPNLDEEILICQKNTIDNSPKGFIEIGYLVSKKETSTGFYYEFMDDRYNELFNVTHWMPLPELPKGI